jgi:hypothetical protein
MALHYGQLQSMQRLSASHIHAIAEGNEMTVIAPEQPTKRRPLWAAFFLLQNLITEYPDQE